MHFHAYCLQALVKCKLSGGAKLKHLWFVGINSQEGVRTICGALNWQVKHCLKAPPVFITMDPSLQINCMNVDFYNTNMKKWQHQSTLTKKQRWPRRKGTHTERVFPKLGQTGGRSGRVRRVQAWTGAQLWQPGPERLSRWSMVDSAGTHQTPAEPRTLRLLHRCASF